MKIKIKTLWDYIGTPGYYFLLITLQLIGVMILGSMAIDRCKVCGMCPANINDGNFNGYYNINDQYYCVWTEGRKPENIVTTECHEQLHSIIYQDEESYHHFCDRGGQENVTRRSV